MQHLPLFISLDTVTAVAVSGGVDSMSLLTVLSAQARAQGQVLYAFHVHHGLHPQADAWLDFVQKYCAQNGVVFDVRRLDATTRLPAQSVEEWARRGRYRALAEMARVHGVRQIVLAQHQDDQIETFLIQSQRGAGARGQAGMPASIEREGLIWLRPWLGVTRVQIEQFAAAHELPFVHDSSNDDTRYARNAIRAQLKHKPLTAAQRAELLRSIHQAQTELAAQSAWARAELLRYHCPHRADIGECARLLAPDLQQYSSEQVAYLLREWFAQIGWRMPSRAALAELIKQLRNTDTDQQMCWRHAEGGAVTQFKQQWIAAQLLPAGQWFLTDELKQRIAQEGLIARARVGGVRVRLAPNRVSMTLKQAYQMREVAPMLRAQLPLLYAGERLVLVVGVGEVFD